MLKRSWDIVWIQDIFYKIQAVIHAHNETLILYRCYTAAQLTSFDIFWCSVDLYIKRSTKQSDIIFVRTNVTKAR